MGGGGGEELNNLNLDGKSKVGGRSGNKILGAKERGGEGEGWGGGGAGITNKRG
jgi:hypothetical protein